MDKSVVVSGSGGHLNIEVVIDGILGTSIVNFSAITDCYNGQLHRYGELCKL